MIVESLANNIHLTDAAAATLAQATEEFIGDMLICARLYKEAQKSYLVEQGDVEHVSNATICPDTEWPMWIGAPNNIVLELSQATLPIRYWVSQQTFMVGLRFPDASAKIFPRWDILHQLRTLDSFQNEYNCEPEGSFEMIFCILPEYHWRCLAAPITVTDHEPWTPPHAMSDAHYHLRNFHLTRATDEELLNLKNLHCDHPSSRFGSYQDLYSDDSEDDSMSI